MQKWPKNIIILIFISLYAGEFAFTQETPVKKDSAQLYRDIEAYSKRSKFNKFMYRLVFKPVPDGLAKKKGKKKVYKKLVQKSYSAFEGKTIRHINIETLDPFVFFFRVVHCMIP